MLRHRDTQLPAVQASLSKNPADGLSGEMACTKVAKLEMPLSVCFFWLLRSQGHVLLLITTRCFFLPV